MSERCLGDRILRDEIEEEASGWISKRCSLKGNIVETA